ncbi:MAG: trypsin-like peptidase domain-containing protein [Terriglobia bacterium]
MMPLTPERVFGLVAPSVVTVECFDKHGNQLLAFGSGVVVARCDVVTNKHVVEKGPVVTVKTRSRRWPARITHLHPDYDLCQLRAENLDAPPVPLGFSSEIAVGERVYAIGSPLGFEITISEGLISGLRVLEGQDVIQTTAPISQGSSGGGLFDCEGKLVAITTSYVKAGQNLNFALPAKLVAMLARHRVAEARTPMALATPAAASPAATVHARLRLKFPGANFEVRTDREQVIHVAWRGQPPIDQLREYLRSLIVRRELSNPEFEFERRDS